MWLDMCHNGRKSEDLENTCFSNIMEDSFHFIALGNKGYNLLLIEPMI